MNTTNTIVNGWAIYLRVSDERKQHPEHSLDAQLRIIQERLISPSGMPVQEIYRDIVSGQTAKRPQYQKMKQAARAGHFSHLGVYRIDRLGRNTLEGLIAFREFIEMGIEVKTASAPDIDPVTPDGQLFMGIQMLMAQHETEIMKQRMNDSKRAILLQGGWPFKAPDGYVNRRERVANTKDRTWIEIDPPRFEMWRIAYDLILEEDLTLREVCIELHRQGYSRSSGKPWVKTLRDGTLIGFENKLSRGLHNPFYAGRIVATTKHGIKFEDGVQGHWQPIVTIEEYQQTLMILAERDGYKQRLQKHVYRLRDQLSVRVGRRKAKLYGSTPTGRSRSYSYYITKVKLNGNIIRIPLEIIEAQIPTWLAQLYIPAEQVTALRRAYHAHVDELAGPSAQEQLKSLEEAVKLLEADETRLVRLLLQRRLTDKAYDELRHEWQVKLSAKLTEIDVLRASRASFVNDLDVALKLLVRIEHLYPQLEPIKQMEVLKLLFKQVVVDQEGTILSINLHAPFAFLQAVYQGQDGEEISLDSYSPTALRGLPEICKKTRYRLLPTWRLKTVANHDLSHYTDHT